MKNPLQYLKHIVKDPINTIAEADARKKEIMPLFYGSLGVLVVGVILQIALELDFMAVASFVGLVGTAFCGFLFSVLKSARKKFEALTCDECDTMAEIKTPEDFAKYVSYVVEQDEAIFKGYSGSKEQNGGEYPLVKFSGSSSAVLTVALTCPHCGKVRHLRYSAVPFKCHAEAKKVSVLEFVAVRDSLELRVRTAVDDYNDPNKKIHIPYTFHSSKNPNFENRFSFKGSNGAGAFPDYMGVKIDYHKDVAEMLLHYFVLNELNGTLSDPNAASKKKNAGKKVAVAVGSELEQIPEMSAGETQTPENIPTPEPEQSNFEAEQSISESVALPESEPCPQEPAQEPEISGAVAVDHREIPEEPPVATQDVTEECSEQEPERKSHKKVLIVAAAVCAALVAGGVIFGVITAIRNHGSKADDPTVQPTTEPVTTAAPDPIMNVNDYVGYWYIAEDRNEELTVHSGDRDSVSISLWYAEGIELSNVAAQLQNNVATFSLAADGAVIKGTLTFLDNAVTVQITHSTQEAIPVETMEFTQLEMSSQRYDRVEEDPDQIIEEPTEYEEQEPDILPFSSYLFLTEADLSALSDDELNLAKNEIYARAGRLFADPQIQAYFDAKDWYYGYIEPENFTDSDLSEIELSNIEFIVMYQKAKNAKKTDYQFKVKTEEHSIYQYPSYGSYYVQMMPKGLFTIVAEQTDAEGRRWGKLASGLGWICLTDIEVDNEKIDREETVSDLQDWQKAYLSFLEQAQVEYSTYALVYVDDDAIPELYLSGVCEAAGDCVATYQNGEVIAEGMSGTGGGQYIPGEGMFLNYNGSMGFYDVEIFTLDDSGFTRIFYGSQEEVDYEDVDVAYEYTIDGVTMSEEEFVAAVEEIYDYSRSAYFDEYVVDYEQIVRQIEEM